VVGAAEAEGGGRVTPLDVAEYAVLLLLLLVAHLVVS
jgi:hypothetical protein